MSRFAFWYWCRFVLSPPHRCLCDTHLPGASRLCLWLEDKACQYEASES